MSNAIFKVTRNRVTAAPVVAAPPPTRRLVKKTGVRPFSVSYVAASRTVGNNDAAYGSERFVTLSEVREIRGTETYTYYVWETVEYPAPLPKAPVVTPVPSGWDSTARSGATLTLPMAAQWVVNPGNVDLIVGLSTQVEPPRVSQNGDSPSGGASTAAALRASIVHGFRIIGGQAYVHHIPPAGFGAVGLDQRRVAGVVENGTVCRIECSASSTAYYVAGVLIATGPSFVREGEGVYMRAALYGVQDTASDPVLESTSNDGAGSATLPPIVVGAGKYSYGGAKFGLFANGPRKLGVRDALAPLWVRGGRANNRANFSLAPLAVTAWSDPVSRANAAFLLPPLKAKGGQSGYADGEARFCLFAFGRGGAPGQSQLNPYVNMTSLVDAFIDPRRNAGSYGVVGVGCEFVAEYRPLRTLLTAVVASDEARASYVWPARLATVLGVRGSLTGARVLDIALVMSTGAKGAVLGVLVVSADTVAAVSANGALVASTVTDVVARMDVGISAAPDTQALYNAALRAAVSAGVIGLQSGADYLVWSVEQSGASAAYQGFAFNSFARLGGRIFAASDTGLYELTGNTDDGEPIAAWIDLGSRDFGTTALKGISNAYLTASSDDKLVMHVTAEGKKYRYEARNASGEMQTQRVDFGKGLRATFINLEISNQNGGDFEIERAEFLVNKMNRRI